MLSDLRTSAYDFDASGAQAYLIMEYMDGITLTELMRGCAVARCGDVSEAVPVRSKMRAMKPGASPISSPITF